MKSDDEISFCCDYVDEEGGLQHIGAARSSRVTTNFSTYVVLCMSPTGLGRSACGPEHGESDVVSGVDCRVGERSAITAAYSLSVFLVPKSMDLTVQ